MKTISLEDFLKKNSISMVISGRPEGKEARKKLKLDKEDLKKDEIVKVMITDKIFSVNTSFFLGLFGKSVRKLTIEGFDKKYQIECSNKGILKNIEDAKNRAVKGLRVLKSAKVLENEE